jgi:hypothetical protein
VVYFKDPIGLDPHRNGVEPVASSYEIAPLDPRASGDGDRVPLFTSDGLQGMPKRHAAAAFHFDERDDAVFFHHEVDFFPDEADIAVEDPPTSFPQMAFGERLESTSPTYVVQTSGLPSGGRCSGGEKNASID